MLWWMKRLFVTALYVAVLFFWVRAFVDDAWGVALFLGLIAGIELSILAVRLIRRRQRRA
jgi:hypothetical protein